jgi:hypothetical protein
MSDDKLSLASIGFFVSSLGEVNELLQALALIISSASGLLVIWHKFKENAKGNKEQADDNDLT